MKDVVEATAIVYRRFAELEARGRSPLYETLTHEIAGDREALDLIDTLPEHKRQPNLVLAAVRYLAGTPADYAALRSTLVGRWPEVSRVILERTTQTNEVARCAALLPVLAGLPQPLALFEVGASAGLCLQLDRYRYDTGAGVIGPPESPVTLRCDYRSPTPVPTAVPELAWRAGCDLHPIDVDDEASVAWLEALTWPGEGDRLERLAAAIDVARAAPPTLTARDVRDGFSDLVAGAPAGATLVVMHSATLTYVPSSARAAFAAEVSSLDARWVAYEGAHVLADAAASLAEEELHAHRGDFLVSLDDRPLAWADPHGEWVQWRADGAAA